MLAASVDAYYEANLLMGQAESPSLEELQARALAIRADRSRLFVFWRSAAGIDCHAVGPSTRCFCGHSYAFAVAAVFAWADRHCCSHVGTAAMRGTRRPRNACGVA